MLTLSYPLTMSQPHLQLGLHKHTIIYHTHLTSSWPKYTRCYDIQYQSLELCPLLILSKLKDNIYTSHTILHVLITLMIQDKAHNILDSSKGLPLPPPPPPLPVHPILLCQFTPSSFASSPHPPLPVHPILLCQFTPSSFASSPHPPLPVHPTLLCQFTPSSFASSPHPPLPVHPILLCQFTPPSFASHPTHHCGRPEANDFDLAVVHELRLEDGVSGRGSAPGICPCRVRGDVQEAN